MARGLPPVLAPEVRARERPAAPRRRLLVLLLTAVLLGQMAVAMVTTAVRQTPVIDEPVYVGTSAEYLHEDRMRHNPEHPPLGKLAMAAGVAIADPHVDPSFTGDQGALGRHLLYESGNDPWRLMLWARLPVIVLTLLFGLVVLAFARDVAGRAAGVVALALYAFSPDVVAHGSLATLDVPVAGFLLTSVWLVWRARRRPRLYLPLAGIALGAALATKMSALPAIPVVTALAVLPLWSARRWKALLGAAVVAVAAVAVVWAAYSVVDPDPTPVPAVHGARGLLVELLPFPGAYRDGLRMQFAMEDQRWTGFLFGRVYTGGRWYYLPAALLVKTPLGMLALWAAGAVTMVAVRRLRPAAPYVLVPAVVLLGVAMTGERNFGTRYVVFLPMFLAVAAGCTPSAPLDVPRRAVDRLRARRGRRAPAAEPHVETAPRAFAAPPNRSRLRRSRSAVRWRWATCATGVLAVSVAVSSLRTYPYYLPYANEAFGGPAHTHERLHDANVDWGQDLGRLADRLRERYPGERVWLVYKGSGVPSAYGIRGADPFRVPVGEVRGLLVVSDSAAATASGRLAELLRGSRAVDEVGHSITLYRR